MPVRALSTIAGNSSPSVYPRAHSASLRSTNLGMSVSPDPSLFLCHTERSEEPMHCACVEERPFRAASERAERGALAPECSSPALRSPVNHPYLLLCHPERSEGPHAHSRLFDDRREFSPPDPACPAHSR